MRFDVWWLEIRMWFYRRFRKKNDKTTDRFIQEVVQIYESLPAGKVVHECHDFALQIQRERARTAPEGK